jgi:hypothetical protein
LLVTACLGGVGDPDRRATRAAHAYDRSRRVRRWCRARISTSLGPRASPERARTESRARGRDARRARRACRSPKIWRHRRPRLAPSGVCVPCASDCVHRAKPVIRALYAMPGEHENARKFQ